jgi:uncharacterized protein
MSMEEATTPVLESIHCTTCARELKGSFKFCPGCGRPALPPASPGSAVHVEWKDTVRFLWACGTMVIYVVGSHLVEEWEDYRFHLFYDLGFLLVMAFVAVSYRRDLGTALGRPAIQVERLLEYLLIQAVITFGVLKFVPWMNEALGFPTADISTAFLDSPAPLPLALLSIAVMPAITEELACRGVLFGQMQRVAGSSSAVIVTAVIFAFVHFNMLSFAWLFMAGLFYGWMRLREGHLWYGVLCHFLHNGTVVLEEMGYF